MRSSQYSTAMMVLHIAGDDGLSIAIDGSSWRPGSLGQCAIGTAKHCAYWKDREPERKSDNPEEKIATVGSLSTHGQILQTKRKPPRPTAWSGLPCYNYKKRPG